MKWLMVPLGLTLLDGCTGLKSASYGIAPNCTIGPPSVNQYPEWNAQYERCVRENPPPRFTPGPVATMYTVFGSYCSWPFANPVSIKLIISSSDTNVPAVGAPWLAAQYDLYCMKSLT